MRTATESYHRAHREHGERIIRIGFASLVAAALLLVTGCNEKKEGSLNPELRSAVVIENTPRGRAAQPSYQPPVQAAPAPAPAPTYATRGIQGPMSQAELDRIYNIPAPLVLAPRTANVAPPIAMPDNSEDGRVVADPSWDVQVSREWRHIVIHHSASASGSASEFDKWHREKGWDGLGYHFVIGNGTGSGNGQVEVGYRWRKQTAGAHAGNAEYNQHGVGICLVGDFQNGTRPTAQQMSSLRQLTRFLQVKTGVPTSEVVGHCNVPGKSTECPGRQLNLGDFRASLGGGAIGVPIHMARLSQPSRSPVPASRSASRGGASLP